MAAWIRPCAFAALLFAITLSASAAARENAEFLREAAAFREAREAGLRSPDGWMALVGLHWLPSGRHRLGSGSDSAIQLAVGPERLGEIELAEAAPAAAVFFLDPGVDVRLDGARAKPGRHVLRPDSSSRPTRLAFAGGSVMLIERGGRFALRVRSATAPSLQAFKNLNWFAPDPGWQVEARFEAHPPGQTLPIVNVLGQVEPTPNPGRLHFERAGETLALEALGDPAEELFLVFADRSSGRESYGAGRFLYAGPVLDGRVRLDFNRATNPPCAYTDFSTCPLPPPENRLPLRILAGEARYGHSLTIPSS